MTLIELKDVSKYYNDGSTSSKGIENITLSFDRGEFVAITGESGSGKTTLLNVITLMDSYDEGDIVFNNKSTVDFSNEDIVSIKEYKKDDNFYTEIKLKDDTIYDRTIEVLNRLKKEGSIDDKIFRANASIEISENAKLNAYTRQMLTQNALKRAYESLFKVLLSNNIEVNKAVSLTNTAYILEESYSSNEYNVVVETIND